MGASGFKEQIARDVSAVFINLEEFAERRLVNGREMNIIVDDNELLERDKSKLMNTELVGTYRSRRLMYVSEAEFGARPAIGSFISLGANKYRVNACTEEEGIYAIELEAIRS